MIFPTLFFLLLLLSPLVVVTSEAATTSAVVSLTKDTFPELTQGKSVFVKFFAPWCGHCQDLAPTWERLAADWADHPQGLIAEVDCTLDAAAERWCSKDFQIVGFPTLLYGETSQGGAYLRKYEHVNKTYEALAEFANRTLSEPFCSPGNIEACSPTQQREMSIMLRMNERQLNRAIKLKEDGIQNKEDQFKREADFLQNIHDMAALNYELDKARIYREVKLLKEILELRQQECSVEDPDESCLANVTATAEDETKAENVDGEEASATVLPDVKSQP